MTKKARVRLGLDTKAAEADLRDLAKEGEKSAGKVNDSLGGGFGRAAALGAVTGAGFGLAQRAASRIGGFMPDVISEASVGTRANIDDFFGGPAARAARGAREQTKSAYAEIIGRMKEPTVTPGIRNYYNNVKDLREITERGNTKIDQELGGDIVEDAFEGIKNTITGGFDRIIEALPIGGK
ncbi:MAG: hypothetical protein GY882_12025 [Actinomycetia bacterium]|nr:hypothetical protein [Actinomycetes bacterium]